MNNLLFFIIVILFSSSVFGLNSFVPGTPWKDTSGNPIKAHAGGILLSNSKYYWYGESQDPNTLGVRCYSSDDLYNWKDEGLVFYVANITDKASSSYIIERPKVLYNSQTKTFVMWFHLDDSSYGYAHTGVATSNNELGPFKYYTSMLPNAAESRDMTVYEDNGKAYLIRSSGHTNVGISISALTADYLNVSTQVSYISQSREAPAVLKYNSLYYLLLSHCTGWNYNAADLWTTDNLSGTWKEIGNPTSSSTTFDSQSTFFLPYKNHFIFMADRWNYPNLSNATYVWLPVSFNGATLQITWHDSWDLSIFD